MNINKKTLAIAISTFLLSNVANAGTLTDTSTLTVTGVISTPNSCSTGLSSSGTLNVGTIDSSTMNNLSTTSLISNTFTTTISCTYATAVAVKFVYSGHNSVYPGHFSDVKDSGGSTVATTKVSLSGLGGTVDASPARIAFIGDQSLVAVDITAATVGSSGDGISSVDGELKNALTFMPAATTELSVGSSFSFDLDVELIARPTSEWLSTIDETFVISENATLETYII
tara:strand:- start:1144 stop:1827 length:684 start_codon:yes stop_codon:yes gene_type:complete